MPRETKQQKRMRRFTELTAQIKADVAVAVTVENWCANRGGGCSVGELAQNNPKEFDLMCAAIDDFLEQAPTPGVEPWMT